MGNNQTRESRASASIPPSPVLTPVYCHVYDLGHLTAVSKLNNVAKQLLKHGFFHVAIEVYGKEYSFGYSKKEGASGVFACYPKECSMHRCRESYPLGDTTTSYVDFVYMIKQLANEWLGTSYNLMHRNCTHFAQALSKELGVTAIPEWVHHTADSFAHIDEAVLTMTHTLSSVEEKIKNSLTSIEEALKDNLSYAMSNISLSNTTTVPSNRSNNLQHEHYKFKFGICNCLDLSWGVPEPAGTQYVPAPDGMEEPCAGSSNKTNNNNDLVEDSNDERYERNVNDIFQNVDKQTTNGNEEDQKLPQEKLVNDGLTEPEPSI